MIIQLRKLFLLLICLFFAVHDAIADDCWRIKESQELTELCLVGTNLVLKGRKRETLFFMKSSEFIGYSYRIIPVAEPAANQKMTISMNCSESKPCLSLIYRGGVRDIGYIDNGKPLLDRLFLKNAR